MKKKLSIFVMLLTAVLYAAGVSAAESIYYVQSVNATVIAAPKFGSAIISKVAKGQTLSSISKDGNWVKVKVDGKEGYISSFLVSTQPPLAKRSVITAEGEEIKPSARRRASSSTSAAAARGLTTDEHKEEKTEKAPDYKAVEKMESVKVTPAEITKFKEAGN